MYDFPVTWLLNWLVSSICWQQRDPSLIRHGSHFLMVCFALGFRHLSLANLFHQSDRVDYDIFCMLSLGVPQTSFVGSYQVVKCSSVS